MTLLAFDIPQRADSLVGIGISDYGSAGATWVNEIGTWGILNKKFYVVQPDLTGNTAVASLQFAGSQIPSGGYNTAIQVDEYGVTGLLPDNPSRPGIRFAFIDSSNFLLARYRNGYMTIIRNKAGVSDLVTAPVPFKPRPGDRWEIVRDFSTHAIVMSVNGIVRIRATADDFETTCSGISIQAFTGAVRMSNLVVES